MKLLTDYRQWYDDIFDAEPPVFHRQAFTRGGLSKRQQFALFESLGLRTPRHGVVRELVADLTRPLLGCAAPPEAVAEARLVVYLDEHAHHGEGKRLLTVAEALRTHPDHYASVFCPTLTPTLSRLTGEGGGTLSPALSRLTGEGARRAGEGELQRSAATEQGWQEPGASSGRTFRLVRLGRLCFWIEQQGRTGDWRSNHEEAERVLTRQRVDAPNPIPRVLWASDFLPTANGLLAVDFNTAPDLTILGESGALLPGEVAEELAWVLETRPEQLRQF